MAHSKPSLSVADQLLVARLRFDGATTEALAQRFEVGHEEIQGAWAFACEHLSRHFAETEGRDYRLLTEAELKERAIDTLRLLLQWRAALEARARLAALGAGSTEE